MPIRSLALLLLALSACASTQAFSSNYPVNRAGDLGAVLARVRATPRPAQRTVVVGLTGAPTHVFAFDVAAGRLLWKQHANASGVPVAAGPYVVVPEGSELRLRNLQDGQVALSLPMGGMHFIGADGDGTLTALAMSSGGSMGAKSRVVFLTNGQVSYDVRVDHAVGGPAVLGGIAFVPHNRVHLSMLDAHGTELARVRVRDDVVSQALAHGSDVYFGLLGVYRLDERTPSGIAAGAAYFRPQRTEPLPGQPRFLPDTTVPPPPPDSAVHRVALTFTPAPREQRVGLADDALYLLFYRQLYALDPMAQSARWVFQSPRDVVGVQAAPGGVVLVDDQGLVTTLDAAGRTVATADLGVQPLVAKIRADQLGGASASGDMPPLALQLLEAALNPDNRLVPARAMAVALLAALDDADATQALISVCEDRASPERVRRGACVALSRRTIGGDAVLAALERHADYLTDTKAPPVGPLAEAALQSKEARAIVPLVAHLKDPETPVEELAPLMAALKGLADPSVAEPIADFVRLYHADADEPRMADALVLGIEALAKIQGPAAQGVLDPIANDGLAAPAVRSAAARALAGLQQQPAAPSEPAAGEEPAPPSEEPVPEGPPARLTTAHVDRALAPVREPLRQCVRSDAKRPMSARLTIVVEGDGRVVLVQTLPESLKACVEPLVRSVAFPATTWGKRDTLSTTLTR